MKRVVAISIIMGIMTSLFAFSVSAASPTEFNSYSDALTLSNVTWSLNVRQFKTQSNGTSALPGGMESIFFVTVTLDNNNDQDAKVTIPKFNITLSEDRTITNLYSYGGNFNLSKNSLSFYLLPDSDFADPQSAGNCIVPANSQLSFVGAIGCTAEYTNGSISDAGLRGAVFYDKSNWSVTLGTYEHGISIDFTDVINAINDISVDILGSQEISDIVQTLSDIESNMVTSSQAATIIGLITYTGPSVSYNRINGYSDNYIESNIADTGLTIERIRTVLSPVIVNYDFELNSSNDTIEAVGFKRYIIQEFIYFYCTNIIRAHAYFRLGDISSGNYYPVIEYLNSDIYDTFYINGNRLQLRPAPQYYDGRYYCLIPSGMHIINLRYYVDVPINIDVSFPALGSLSFFSTNPIVSSTVTYLPNSEYGILRDLFLSFKSDSIDQQSSELGSLSDSNHQSEAAWYEQNQQNIESTGLSNFRFTTPQISGTDQVIYQFQQVWNALGNYTGVYIFILSLSLATFIIRHEPTTRVKQYRQKIAEDRADSKAYRDNMRAKYGASGSSKSSTMKAAIRRRS